jgi:hypothetical protein
MADTRWFFVMDRSTGRIHCFLLLCIVVFLPGTISDPLAGAAAQSEPPLSDSLYSAHHPRLLFSGDEIPALYNKVRDGGHDSDAYAVIRDAAVLSYPLMSMEELLDDDFGLNTIPNLGLAGFLESPVDTTALVLGRELTLYIADHYDVDNDNFSSSLRLRSLALGYDMFFQKSSQSQRDYVRNEIISYMDAMTTLGAYNIWRYRPYLGNKSTMIAASLGLAAVCLDGETDPSRVGAALDYADEMTGAWLTHQLDENGAYNEGLVYGSWSMRMLIYYFHARKRYDGFDYSQLPRIRNMEKWFAYELLPEGTGRTNNLNDCAYKDRILSRHHTYIDWAQAEWNSALSAWLWEHVAGDDGYDWGLEADKAATVLWNLTLPPQRPDNVLPRSFLWEHRGLYYYRSGWNLGPNSKDVVFSFYSGVFQGAHAQEDQGQFTLYGYGAKFAIDHGPGAASRQTEAHNLILIDGRGQHNAGNSIGTDGTIGEYLLSDYADYVLGDVTDAYTTHSEWNAPGVPFPGSDWSWGYDGGNPVDYALRKVVVVHDSYLPSYFILVDEIEKDGTPHLYEWRLHTHDANTVDTSANPIRISNGTKRLDIHVLEPEFGELQKSVAPFANDSEDPDALVLSLSVTDTSPRYAVLMLPGDDRVRTPVVSKVPYSWGYAVSLNWGMGLVDVFICNPSGGTVTHSFGETITTDAQLSLVRVWRGVLLRYLLTNTTAFTYNSTNCVAVSDARLSCAFSGSEIQIDRYNAQFVFYAPNVDEVYWREQPVPVISQDGYLMRDPAVGAGYLPRDDTPFRAEAYPNPFNPATTVRVDLKQRAEVHAVIYDVGGKAVKTLARVVLPSGISTLEWDGSDEHGNRAASGVYFLKIDVRGYSQTLKLVVLK